MEMAHHEVWLCEDPPEFLGLHVVRVTGDCLQYLQDKRRERKYCIILEHQHLIQNINKPPNTNQNNKIKYLTSASPRRKGVPP